MASSSLARSFWLWIFRSAQTLGAARSPKPGMASTGTGSNGSTHSSRIPYFSRSLAFFFRSVSAMKSSAESLGTLVTTPVPFFVDTVSIGRTWIFSYTCESGDCNARPIRSWPLSSTRQLGFPHSGVWSWYDRLSAARAVMT